MKDFMSKFNTEARKIRNLNSAVALHAIMTGIRPGLFADSLAMDEPKSIDELRERAEKFIDVEEADRARKVVRGAIPGIKSVERGDGGYGDGEKGRASGSDWLMSFGRGRNRNYERQLVRPMGVKQIASINPRNDEEYRYTPLTMEREKVLREVYLTCLIEMSIPSNVNLNANRSKRCEYHRAFGHDTEECSTLKK